MLGFEFARDGQPFYANVELRIAEIMVWGESKYVSFNIDNNVEFELSMLHQNGFIVQRGSCRPWQHNGHPMLAVTLINKQWHGSTPPVVVMNHSGDQIIEVISPRY